MPSVDQEIDQFIPTDQPEGENPTTESRPRGRPKKEVPTVTSGDTESAYAAALAQVQAQVAELKKELNTVRQSTADGEMADSGISGYPWQYYRRPVRQDDPMSNWIVIAPGGTAAAGKFAGRRAVEQYAHYQGKGFLPITAYGPAPVPNVGNDMLWLLERGGAKEFPATQVLAYKWHVKPPLPGLLFPEYEKIKGTEILAECEECNWNEWGLEGDKTVSVDFLLHLRQKHGYPRKEAALLIREQGLPQIGRMAIRADQMSALPSDEDDDKV